MTRLLGITIAFINIAIEGGALNLSTLFSAMAVMALLLWPTGEGRKL